MTPYSPEALRRLRKRGMAYPARMFEHVRSVRHIFPRAYCVAKPAAHCAVFVVPPQDAEPHVSDKGSVLIQNASVADVEQGQWASIAYLVTKETGEFFVLDTQ